MLYGITTIIGVAVTCFILWLVGTNLKDDEHGILKFFIILTIFAILLLMPKILLDAQTVCESVVANSTVSGLTTSYEYTSFCFKQETSTTGTFMRIILWTYYVIIGYVMLYLFIQALKALGLMAKMRGGNNG